MIVGQKYVSSEIDTVYDAIVIGSGLGGLTTAALMAKAGKKVLVLERHYTAGGFTHSFKRRGYEWDVGVHYVGEVHNPNSPLRRVFDVITDGKLEWAKMDAVYDKIIIQDAQYNFVAGAANFREELLKSFPNARKQIDAYLRHIRAASMSLPAHFGPRFLPGALQASVGSMVGRISNKYFNRTTQAVMADFITDPRLASVLCGQWGDYGLPPGQSSFAMHAVVAQHYLGGGNFPVGGASQIARYIEPVIQRSGGAVVVGAEVEQIMVQRSGLLGKGDRAIGVRMANGDEILSQQVISAAGLYNTYGKLMPEEVGTRHKLSEKLTPFKPSVAHLGLYVGLNASAADLQLEQANKWVYRDYDHDKSLRQFLAKPSMKFPLNYISFPSSKDPAWDTHYPGKATIDVITLAPFDWFSQWADKPWKNRGADYDAFKAKLSEALLEEVYKHAPSARGKVDYYELSTPLSTAHFNNYAKGQLYGMEHTPERFAQSWVKPATPIKGLYLTGQDILFCGVASAMMSGVMTATSALGSAATKLMPELVTDRARWLTKTLDAMPLVGSSTSSVREAVGKLAPPDPIQRPLVGRCLEVVNVTADTKALRFVDESGAPWVYKPGQFVTLELEIGGKKLFRSYTMSSTPTQTGYFEITVKRVYGGVVSNWLCDHVAVGTALPMTGPHGKFSCAPKPRRKLLMLSAGSGVTPMLSMARWIRDQGIDSDVVYFHCARTEADLMFAEEVADMAQTNPRFVQHISLTRSAKPTKGRGKARAAAQTRWSGLTGYLDAAMLRAVASDYEQREIYVCGPSGFMEGTKAMVEAAGFDMRHYHEESFGTANKVQASGGVLWLAKSGVEVACSGEQSILDAALQAGVKISSACRTGDCGECKVRKLSGDAPMANTDGLDAQDLEDGDVLSCVAFVNGKVAIDA
jgi:all-trans-retinol 13,14-reductase